MLISYRYLLRVVAITVEKLASVFRLLQEALEDISQNEPL